MPVYRLRPTKPEDARAIRALVHAARINPLGLDWRRFIVAVNSVEEIIGCAQVKPHREKKDSISGELASIVVAPAWRGQGVARALIENMLASHAPPLYLTCRASLEPFYERFGFQVIHADSMPPYFRRVSRLMTALRYIRLADEGLSVMAWRG